MKSFTLKVKNPLKELMYSAPKTLAVPIKEMGRFGLSKRAQEQMWGDVKNIMFAGIYCGKSFCQ